MRYHFFFFFFLNFALCTYESQANDDQNWYHTNDPSDNVRPFWINVDTVFEGLVFDPVEEEDEEKGGRCNHFPHPGPEKSPETATRPDHLLYIVEKSIRAVNPGDQDALTDGY